MTVTSAHRGEERTHFRLLTQLLPVLKTHCKVRNWNYEHIGFTNIGWTNITNIMASFNLLRNEWQYFGTETHTEYC